MTPEVYEPIRDSKGFIRLHGNFSSLYQKTNYLADVDMLQNRIIEYDLKSANLSALRASGKIDESVLKKLELVDKHTREVRVGMMVREDKEIGRIIKRGIFHARELLFRANMLQDEDILSIKNDAVFIIGKKLKHTSFGPYQFVQKNTYSMFVRLDKLEFYYNYRQKKVDIKGLGNVTSEEDHQNGMMCFFEQVFRYLIQGRRDDLRKYLIQFVDDYKCKRLPIQYYKELNRRSVYRTKYQIAGYGYNIKIAGDSDREIVDGIYNYNRYIIPFVQTFL